MGNAVRRVEDPDLIQGQGTYVDNITVAARCTWRSSDPVGARPVHVNRHRRRPRAAPGVVAVFTAADLDLPAHHGFFVLNAGVRPPAAGHRPGAVRRRGRRRRRRARPAPQPSTPSSWSRSTTTRCPRSPTWRPRWRPAPRCSSTRSGQPRRRRACPDDRGRARRRRGRRAGADRQPAAGGRADGGQRDRSSSRARTATSTTLTIHVSTQMPHGFRPPVAGLPGSTRAGPRDRPARRRRLRRQGRVPAEHTVAIAVARAPRPPGELGRDPLGEPALDAARPRPGRVRRARAAPRTARSPGCGCRVVGDAGAYAGLRRRASPLGPTYMMASGVYDIPKLGFDGASRR